MRFPPPSVIATWPTPNYVDPPTQKPYLIPLLVLLTLAATCMVLLRLYTRFFHSHTGSDDWLIVVAIIPGIAYTICVSIAVTHFGWDRHVWDIAPGAENINVVRERAISWACQMLYVLAANITKISLLCFYRRAFTTSTMHKVVTWFLAITVTYLVVCILLLCLECRPLNFYWEEFRIPPPSHGSCDDEGTSLMITSTLNLIIDITILLLPIPTVLTLNIHWAQKLQVLSIFAAGVLVVISSTIRIYEIWQTTEVTYDVTWRGYNLFLFTGIEIFLGLICACLPACRALLKQWRESARQSNRIPNSDDGKQDFSTTVDSTHTAMPPPNVIKKRTKTTVDVTYMRMENPNQMAGNRSGSQLGSGISSFGSARGFGDGGMLESGAGGMNVWNGSATNVTRAWAGTGSGVGQKEKERGRKGNERREEVEMDGLGFFASPAKMDTSMSRGRRTRVAFGDEKNCLKEEEEEGGGGRRSD